MVSLSHHTSDGETEKVWKHAPTPGDSDMNRGCPVQTCGRCELGDVEMPRPAAAFTEMPTRAPLLVCSLSQQVGHEAAWQCQFADRFGHSGGGVSLLCQFLS